jgi:hypothetical protein
MAHTTCLACLVYTVSGCRKKRSEKQALVAGTKQSKQAKRAVMADKYVCFCFVPATSTIVEVNVSQTNICICLLFLDIYSYITVGWK